MDLILIRHGQSEANEKGLLISNETDDLTQLGRYQSKQLSGWVANNLVQANFIFSSPWQRAKSTAVEVFKHQQAEIHYDVRLAETNPGIYGTWQEAEFNHQFPDFYDDLTRAYQGGESHMQMADRVIDWLEEVVISRVQDPGVLAVVAHGGPISVILQYILGMPIEHMYPSFTVPNASFSKLVWRQDLQRYVVIHIGYAPTSQ